MRGCVKTNNGFLVQREQSQLSFCLAFILWSVGVCVPGFVDVLNGQPFVARLGALSGLVWLGLAQVLLIQTRGWVQHLISHQEARLSIRWPTATVNAKCYTKRSHETAPAAPCWSRRTIFFLNSLNYCNIRRHDLSLSTADPKKKKRGAYCHEVK